MFPSVCLKNRYSLKLVISAYFNYSANAVFLLTKLLVRGRKLKISVKKKKKNCSKHEYTQLEVEKYIYPDLGAAPRSVT